MGDRMLLSLFLSGLGLWGAVSPVNLAGAADGYAIHVSGREQATATAIVLDVYPLDTEVRVDGVRLGTSSELMGYPVTVGPGTHVVSLTAPGFHPAAVRVNTVRGWASRVYLEMVPDRNR